MLADTLRALYKSLVRLLIEYADVVWNGCSDSEGDLLDFVQYEEGKIVTVAMKGTSRQRLMSELGREELNTKRAIHKLTLYFKIVNNLAPHYLKTSYLPALARELTFPYGIVIVGLLFVLRWRPGIDLAQQDSVTLFFIRSSTIVLELHNSPEEEQG